ncbi:repeat domain-containing 42-like isoform X2 [Octopus vulgaris]|uniref:Repeat domain-containing 42-like isoform X2 n=1 Tax=Octopus vulgaris TaxID=6645 RepID=A0AA36AFV0_OCTVU|nr:repeat domain-containing 42-like isoform X2 [Octopus vulgaris]
MPAIQKYSNIHEAVKAGDVNELTKMVKCGASVNEIRGRDKFTPLHTACDIGALEVLHWLMWKRADPNLCTPQGWTPAHIAAIRGEDTCLQALSNNNVSLNVRDNYDRTPLHIAAAHGNSFCLYTILRNATEIDADDKNGWTAVHHASFHGHLGCVQTLYKWHAKTDVTDKQGNTPAHLAAMEGNLLCLKFLVSCKSDPNDILKASNDLGEVPKDLASQFYKENVVNYIEAIEWKKEHPEKSENLSFPAHVAASRGNLEHLQMLVENGIVSINECDSNGSTLAHKAAGQGQTHILQWLIEMGATVSISNHVGDSPKDLAERFAHLACIKLLQDASPEEDEITQMDLRVLSRNSTAQNTNKNDQALDRAKEKVQDLEEELNIARKNYSQLGGMISEEQKQRKDIQEKNQTIKELETQLEYERLRREKLEAQVDECQQQLALIGANFSSEDTDASSDISTKPSNQVPTKYAKSPKVNHKHKTEGLEYDLVLYHSYV